MSADAPGRDREDVLWAQCILMVAQIINLRRRRLHILKAHARDLPGLDENIFEKKDEVEQWALTQDLPIQTDWAHHEAKLVEDMYRVSDRVRQMYIKDTQAGKAEAYSNTHNAARA